MARTLCPSPLADVFSIRGVCRPAAVLRGRVVVTSIDRFANQSPPPYRSGRGIPRAWLLAACCGLAAASCRSRPPEDTAALAGTVLIDGTPVRRGGIQFMPIDRGRPAFSPIVDGTYAARVPKGRVRVIVSSAKETGRTIEVYSTTVPEVVDALPPSLREGIEITVEQDDPRRNFDLSSDEAEKS